MHINPKLRFSKKKHVRQCKIFNYVTISKQETHHSIFLLVSISASFELESFHTISEFHLDRISCCERTFIIARPSLPSFVETLLENNPQISFHIEVLYQFVANEKELS